MKYRDSIFIASDNRVYIRGLRDPESGDSGPFINNATLTLSLHTSEANAAANTSPISNASSIAMDYITGSNGDYRGVLPYTLTLTIGTVYWVGITIDSTAGRSRKVRPYTVRVDSE